MKDGKALFYDGFTRTFEVRDDPIEWGSEIDVEEQYRKAGYTEKLRLDGSDDTVETLTVRRNGTNGRFLVEYWSDDSLWFAIHCQGVVSLLGCLREVAPLRRGYQERMLYALDELKVLGQKAFEAWHGHTYEDFCSDCDHNAWAMKLRRERIEAERRRETSKPEGPR